MFCYHNTQFCITCLHGKNLGVRIIVAPTVCVSGKACNWLVQPTYWNNWYIGKMWMAMISYGIELGLITVQYTVTSIVIWTLAYFLPVHPTVTKSCNIECSGSKMHQIVTNMTLSQYLEVERSLLWRAIVSGYRPLSYIWVQIFQNYWNPYFLIEI